MTSATAPSTSSARSASTLRIIGWSIELALEHACGSAHGARACASAMRIMPGRRDRAVEPRELHHLDDGAHAAAFLADAPREGLGELDLGGRIGAVAELVLEPLEAQRR